MKVIQSYTYTYTYTPSYESMGVKILLYSIIYSIIFYNNILNINTLSSKNSITLCITLYNFV